MILKHRLQAGSYMWLRLPPIFLRFALARSDFVDWFHAVRQRVQVVLCLFAWCIATGCQWDLAQLVAWGRMFKDYSQAMSLSAAAQKTFSGEMCPLCKAVQKGKQEQEQNAPKSTAPGKADAKLLDACPLSTMASVLSPERKVVGTIIAQTPSVGRARTAPPVPPPRLVA